MWQLDLLSLVIPAFGALGKEFVDSLNDDPDRIGYARDLYSDISNIGSALALSRGEWAHGLREYEVDRLLKVLESRLPTRWEPFEFLKPSVTDQQQFHKLQDLAKCISSCDLGGYGACSLLLGQTQEERNSYLQIIRHSMKFKLFRSREEKDKSQRDKFLIPIKEAREHLLNVYCRVQSETEVSELTLSQHPSSGMKELADKIYKMLERHWQCSCAQKAPGQHRSREARLSLIKYQLLALRLSSTEPNTQRCPQKAKYEVLLPICNRKTQWKVTNVGVTGEQRVQDRSEEDWQTVEKNICQWLDDSEGFTVDFVIENEELWHLRPRPSEEVDHHTVMKSLQQILGEGIDISRYHPKEKLTLCYVLATSMLYLYPGLWLQSEWNSDKVCFTRRPDASPSKPVALDFPYLSVDIHHLSNISKPTRHHMQAHVHPNILALGIIYLEIATGSPFLRPERYDNEPSWKQCNRDLQRALSKLKELEIESERDRSRRISPAFEAVVRSCLKLEPPVSCASNNLVEEGPIRQYILSCIIGPLASDLVNGYGVRLEDLHGRLEKETQTATGMASTKLGSGCSDISPLATDNPTSFRQSGPITFRGCLTTTDGAREVSHMMQPRRQELSLLADNEEGEMEVGDSKISYEKRWLDHHNDVLFRLDTELRDAITSDAQRVKIAILDSGVKLDPEHPILSDHSRVKYQDFVNNDTTWRDNVGHGTHLASLLWGLAPNAEIHVARVFKKRPREGTSIAAIIDAVRHSVDIWDVDIIVMSFGFAHFHAELNEAIQRAANEGVLVFAAASNGGRNDGIAWPAREENVICVHSADGLGNPSFFTPPAAGNSKVMTLGECVKSAWPPDLKSNSGQKRMSGTSCAAPIAAAIAAIILDYGRGFLTDKEWRSLCRASSMRRMLEAISESSSKDGDYCWIKHWALFDPDRSVGWIRDEIRRHTL